MPIFEFQSEDGERRDFIQPAAVQFFQFEGKNWSKVNQPVRIAVPSGNKGPQLPHGEAEMKRGYYAEECKHGSRWRSKFSKRQIKKAYNW